MAWRPILNSQSLVWVGGGRGRAVHSEAEVGGGGNSELPRPDSWGWPQSLGAASCSDQPWLNSHDDSKVVAQEVRSVISLSAVLPSLEKGQDQNDAQLREEKMSGSLGILVLGTDLVPALKENVWVSRALRMSVPLQHQRHGAGCTHPGASRMFCNELSFGLLTTVTSLTQTGWEGSSLTLSFLICKKGIITVRLHIPFAFFLWIQSFAHILDVLFSLPLLETS